MLEKIKEILNRANCSYKVIYEEAHMMNVKADEIGRCDSFVYIEEFIRGQYTQEAYRKTKTMQVQVYFSRFTEMQNDATEREALRQRIEDEIVEPFMEEYEKSGIFEAVTTWSIFYPLPRWDANEVSVMLQFPCKVIRC